MDHDRYDDDYIASILSDCRIFAFVGASANTSRPSYFAMKYLLAKGYAVIPINPGQAGILSVGEVAERPVVTDDGIGSAHLMEITLACDHRILYGADGAEFLASVKANLEEPGLLA